jgi:RND family efflux transporter MFP subunit
MTHLLMLVLALGVLAACKEQPKAMSFPPAVVEVSPVQITTYSDKSDFLGTLKSRKSVTISPHVDGHIVAILVQSGQMVQAGQLLMKIDSRMQSAQVNAVAAGAESVEADIATARATLASLESQLKSKTATMDYTRAQHQRYVSLQKDGAVSKADLDSWTNNSSVAQAERDSILQQVEAQKMIIHKHERSHEQALASTQAQKEQLRYYEIHAPFSGMIGDVPAKVGDHVTTSTALTTLTENHPLELYLSIPAEKASMLSMGSHVTLKSADGKVYGDSNVSFIAPTVDPGSQTVLLKALYPNSKSQLRAEQTVRAEIVWEQKPGITIPTKAVTQSAGKFFVFVADDSQGNKLVAKQVEIEVAGIEGATYEVKSGLKPTDRIVTSGIQRLADGAPIVAKEYNFVNSSESTAQSKQGIH